MTIFNVNSFVCVRNELRLGFLFTGNFFDFSSKIEKGRIERKSPIGIELDRFLCWGIDLHFYSSIPYDASWREML